MKYLSNTRIPHHAKFCHTTYMKRKPHHKSYANLQKGQTRSFSKWNVFLNFKGWSLWFHILPEVLYVHRSREHRTKPVFKWLQRRTLSRSVRICILCTSLTIFTIRIVPPLWCHYQAIPQPHWGKGKGNKIKIITSLYKSCEYLTRDSTGRISRTALV